MKKTASSKQAVSMVAEQIVEVQTLNMLMHYAEGKGNKEMAEDYMRRAQKEAERYFHMSTAFCFLFDVRFTELERMALESKGYTEGSAEEVWENARR